MCAMNQATGFDKLGKNFPKGAVLFREGDAGSEMYVVHAGRVELTRKLRDRDTVLAQVPPGEFFGENRLFDLLPKLTNLSTDQIGETIIKELDRFIGEARATDDVTIAILRRV